MSGPLILCVAGEASGDALLAPIVSRIRAAGGRAVGIGGDRAAEAGLELLAHARDVAGHGLVEAAHTLPAVLGAWRRLRARLPAASGLVLVDFPEVNLRLLARAARRGLPALYVAPPQAWAWRARRVSALRQARWVGCLLPFEARWYAQRGVPATCIGHPLAERAPPPLPEAPGLALLPGSRGPTVERMLPLQLAAAERLRRRFARLTVHVGVAPTVDRAVVEGICEGAEVTLHADADPALDHSTVAIAGAGTATLHATLAGRSVVTLARLHPLSWAVARRLVRVEHVALPNLVLERRVWPELLQEDCTPYAIAAAAGPLLEAPGRWHDDFAALRRAVHRPDGMARLMDELDRLVSGARGPSSAPGR